MCLGNSFGWGLMPFGGVMMFLFCDGATFHQQINP